MSDFATFRRQVAGKTYGDFLKHHIRNQAESQRMIAIQGLRERHSSKIQGESTRIISHWVGRSERGDLDGWDCADVADAFLESLEDEVGDLRDPTRFDLFELMALQGAQRSQERLATPKKRMTEGLLSMVGVILLIVAIVQVVRGSWLIALAALAGMWMAFQASYAAAGKYPGV